MGYIRSETDLASELIVRFFSGKSEICRYNKRKGLLSWAKWCHNRQLDTIEQALRFLHRLLWNWKESCKSKHFELVDQPGSQYYMTMLEADQYTKEIFPFVSFGLCLSFF